MTLAFNEENESFDEQQSEEELPQPLPDETGEDDVSGEESPYWHLLMRQLEALLLAGTEPLTEQSFVTAVGRRGKKHFENLIVALNREYVEQERAFEILKVAGGYLIYTRPEHGEMLRRFLAEKARTRLSRAALESLSVIAFRGPVTRADIDEIRGVDSGGVLRTLLDRRLIRVKGRAEVAGRPLLYETTDEFLKYFGISDISELPRHAELTRELGEWHDRTPDIFREGRNADVPDLHEDEYADGEVKSGNGHSHLEPKNLGDSTTNWEP
ncbi:SMC-Scp complex subunit ScpB [bacterium]|nr:SMC-Scp complex subunit ScpB [bacterium]